MKVKLSKHIAGFPKLHGTQHSLITVLEKWESALHNGKIFVFYFSISQRPLHNTSRFITTKLTL